MNALKNNEYEKKNEYVVFDYKQYKKYHLGLIY